MIKSILKLQGVKKLSRNEKTAILAGCPPSPAPTRRLGVCLNDGPVWVQVDCDLNCLNGTRPVGCDTPTVSE